MAIDTTALVNGYLDFAIKLDPTIESFIPQAVDGEIAIQGWYGLVISDQQKAYIAKLTTKALLPRIIGNLARKMQKVKGGPAEAEYVDAIEAAKLLLKALTDDVKAAAKNVDPADAVDDVVLPTYPNCGMMKI